MLLLLGITNNFSKTLQIKDQEILNAMSLMKSTKQQLYKIRDDDRVLHDEWESLINKVYSICENYKIEFLVMNDEFDSKNSKKRSNISNISNSRWSVLTFYPEDFSHIKQITLEHQLGLYIDDIRENERFSNLKNLGDLACMMVNEKKHLSYPNVFYRFLKLVLTLHVATAKVERCFSAMKIVKTTLRNRIKLFEKVTNEIVVKRF
ncbi:hypothetical protein N665_0966s0011 [Sinapis alba]|nr:hypothetical protein N665_0966s0011 [Sinapis alba]